MLPAVSTGPLDPAWSPDGRWIAFSMRGDIWKVPAEGGEPIALTQGPAYHFEPAWSPDGARHRALDGHRRQPRHRRGERRRRRRRAPDDRRQVDVEPAWSRDGAASLLRQRAWRRLRHLPLRLRGQIARRRSSPAPRDQIQPADLARRHNGSRTSRRRGRLGTGGHLDEAADRRRADARALRRDRVPREARLDARRPGVPLRSDETGSNDVAIVPAGGGNPVVLDGGSR